jgi:hypothetical protein
MNYLENNICKFKPLWNFDINKNYNIFCGCFFKMPNHYKNFNIYVNGIKKWIIFLNKMKYDYYLRLFIDTNIYNDKDIMKLLNSSNKIQLVLFECMNYQIEKLGNKYHIDLFGTLVRYFPLFNFNNNDAKSIIIVDIDLSYDDRYKLSGILNYKNKEKDIIVMGTVDSIFNNEIPHVFSGLMYYWDKKYDKNILLEFINKAPEIDDTSKYNKRTTAFGYGVDELFITKYFMLHTQKYVSYIMNYNINWFIYFFKDYFTKKYPKRTFAILKNILGKNYNNNLTTENMLNKIDICFFEQYTFSNERNYYTKNFYRQLKILNDKKLGWFKKSINRIIIKYFDNIIMCNAFVKININTGKIVNIAKSNIIYINKN